MAKRKMITKIVMHFSDKTKAVFTANPPIQKDLLKVVNTDAGLQIERAQL